MATLILIVHVLVCLFLISIVLLQRGKGAELGAAFGGGSSQTLFGSRGAATFLNKLTTVSAIVFMLTSLTLAIVTAKGGSIMKKSSVVTEEKETPAKAPEQGQGWGVKPEEAPPQKQIPQPSTPSK